MKILLWQTAYLGDVVLTTPLIRTILHNLPDAELTFVGRPFIVDLLKGYPIKLLPFSKGFIESFQIIEKIKENQVAISPHVSMRTALILFFSGIPKRVGFDRSELSLLYTHRVRHRWELHEADRNLELLRPLGITRFIRRPLLYVDEEERQKVKEKFKLPQEYVVISPFSNFRLKEWSLKNWLELEKNIDLPVVVVGTKDRVEEARAFKTQWNLVGSTNLRELLAVIGASKLVVSCDSSPVHMANALGVPAITIYTSTSSRYGFYPLMGGYLEPYLPCSPCSPNPKVCKTGSYACKEAVKPNQVLEMAYRILS